MAPPDQLYRGVTRIFSVVIVGIGVAILVVTVANGGGPLSTGFLIGVLFTALGIARLYLALRSGG
ncbi:MAG: hypothetical protein AABM66_09480 [Actinomycetota bacterium]